MTSTWMPIPGHDGYEISDAGEVRSWLNTRRARIAVAHNLKTWLDKDGYRRISIVRRKYHVHRLVLLVYVGPCPDGHEASHINGCRADNRASNLEWSRHAENCRRKVEHGTEQIGERHGCHILTEADIIPIRAARGRNTAAEVAAQYAVTKWTIYDIWWRRTWRHIPANEPDLIRALELAVRHVLEGR